MKSRILTALALSGAVLASGATASTAVQQMASRRDMEKFTDTVMQAVAAGQLEQAYARLKANVTLPPQEIDAALRASLAQRNAQFDARFGAAVGYELISHRKLGDSLWRFTYLEQRQKQPLVWTFQFYSTGDGWQLHEFAWTPQTADL
jgi:hypothetical protein